jgi:hypothetical protein
VRALLPSLPESFLARCVYSLVLRVCQHLLDHFFLLLYFFLVFLSTFCLFFVCAPHLLFVCKWFGAIFGNILGPRRARRLLRCVWLHVVRVARWVAKLAYQVDNAPWVKERNLYCAALLHAVATNRYPDPFHACPPEGNLPALPAWVGERARARC